MPKPRRRFPIPWTRLQFAPVVLGGGIVLRMKDDERVPVSFRNPVWIHGALTVEETTNLYGSVSFKMAGTSVAPYEW